MLPCRQPLKTISLRQPHVKYDKSSRIASIIFPVKFHISALVVAGAELSSWFLTFAMPILSTSLSITSLSLPPQHAQGGSHHSRGDSRVSIASKPSFKSNQSHQHYLDSLLCPTQDMVEQISEVQRRKEKEVMMKKLNEERGDLSGEERRKAAAVIQRNYRGHRERRMLAGLSLDPSARWVEAVKEARYRHLTEPRPRPSMDVGIADGTDGSGTRSNSMARQNWKKIGVIAKRAGGDEDSDHSSSEEDEDLSGQEREARRKRRLEEKAERQKAAKMMDLQYFLEMVDVKHRYGSNLRTYHEQWKKADTKENFFYWLDYGEGRYIDCPGCPRSRLDSEQVRYLSKAERFNYLVKIDEEGRLCWAKNGARIDTTEKYKDSIQGIVPSTDETPAYTPRREENATSSDSSSESGDSEFHDHKADHESARAKKYATPEFDNSKGVKKVTHVSAATIFNKLLRGSVKKNTWIFVADTSFRLYVGIKQSGSFQHSSFLHGARISAAGLIKVKNGRLSKLSPLSGHYRPPVSNFRAFVHSLKEAGVDMSHVSISRSYAVLVGLEAYVKTRRRGKNMVKKIIHGRDKLLSPEETARREEQERDKSESAATERRFLEMKQQAEEEDRDIKRANKKLLKKLHLKPLEPEHKSGATELHTSLEEPKDLGEEVEPQAPGTGPENAIAPEGTRDT